ncbi:hypothetical protein [Faecalimicrobium dakarense]|uniref:hypothetical protein n=1 Tax=Faecalimicrobium dakarense TaxID=1301100 RepID=UPI0004B663F5|nr:hypothetical protein [[Clostridium] dakarense]
MDYAYSIIDLDDNTTTKEIVNTIINDEGLNLPGYLKKDISNFLNYFYNNYFKSYFNKNINRFDKKSDKINEILEINDVNVIKFMEDTSGIKFNKKIKSVFYYNFNPIQPQEFKKGNVLLSTIQPDTTAKDILSIPFHEYSRSLFKTFTTTPEFLDVCNLLKENKEFIEAYNDIGKGLYTFEEWCEINLIEGFSKYLDYKYYKSAYEYTRYIYDLDFYNYLKDNSFNPNKISLKDISIKFYKSKLNTN